MFATKYQSQVSCNIKLQQYINGALVSAHKVKDGMFKTGKIEIVETNLNSAFKK